jgi:hypothetical protein
MDFCSVVGPEDSKKRPTRGLVSSEYPNEYRMSVDHCDLIMKNSTGGGPPVFNYYLALPRSTAENFGGISAHLDCVDAHLNEVVADDPSGIITGNVSLFVNRQKNRATRVEAYPSSAWDDSGPEYHVAIEIYELDIDKGGVKELEVSGDVLVKTKSPEMLVDGTEMTLVLFNASKTRGTLSFEKDYWLRGTTVITLEPGETRVVRFVLQPRQEVWTITSSSPHLPGGYQQVMGEGAKGGMGILLDAMNLTPSAGTTRAPRTVIAYVLQSQGDPVMPGKLVKTTDGFEGALTSATRCWVKM